MRKRLGCLSTSGLAAALLTLLVLAGVIGLWGGAPFSPGPLNAQVGQAELGGVRSHDAIGGQCSACHAAPWSGETMSDRCLLCHVDIASQLLDPSSLHGVLMPAGESIECYACHTEHQGPEAPMTVVDPDRFPHEVTGYSLQAHRQTEEGLDFACAGCHGADITRFEPATCGACHRDLDAAYMQGHQETFGMDCLACHDGIDTYGQAFDHNQQEFPLEGQHASLSCAGCHLAARSLADLQAAPRDCYACHAEDDAHDGQLGQDCAGCHTTEDWPQATFDHAQTAFPLTGRHTGVDCRDCHTGAAFQGTPQDCYACHAEDDAHDGQLGQDCAGCYITEDWQQAIFDHAQTAFPLTGRHTAVDCRDCHIDRTFQGTPQDCYACHAEDDAHDGQLGQDCAGCHTTQDWQQATFDHAQTAFPLTGQHTSVDCRDCHTDGVFQGTPQDCYACHAEDDAHEGQYGQDCAGCHTTEDWQQATFDHAQTAFPLTGRHAGVDCRDCHTGGVFQGTPQDCYACHAEDDAHEGQYGQDCAGCHTTEDWQQATFDHAQTAFPLTGRHTGVNCRDCHTGGVFQGTSRDCRGCHEDPVFHLGLLGVECDTCHTTDGWTPARYDRPHTFPISHGESGPSPCRTCHPDTLAAYTCYDCHEHNPAEIESEHRKEGISDFEDCVRCHPTGREDEAEGEGGGGDD